jgi:hypothetical protein
MTGGKDHSFLGKCFIDNILPTDTAGFDQFIITHKIGLADSKSHVFIHIPDNPVFSALVYGERPLRAV